MSLKNFSATDLKRILPQNRDPVKLHDAMMRIFPKYDIVTNERIAMFLGQCAHESGQFNIMTENLNYSAAGLLKTFKKYYNPALANAHARNPEKIANHVYANRMGNGPESSGDGWKFRGHGFIQLTGRSNHTSFYNSLGLGIDAGLAYIKTLDGALESSCWFWKTNGLNAFADRIDIEGATRRINGGTNGLKDRIGYVRKALLVLEEDGKSSVNPAPTKRTVLRFGDKGEDVFELQQKLTKAGFRVSIDGDFGKGTKAAVEQFQTMNKLTADGVAGPKTLALL